VTITIIYEGINNVLCLNKEEKWLSPMSKTLDMLNSHNKYWFDPQCDNPKDLPDQTGIYMICVKNKSSLNEKMLSAVYQEIIGFPIIYIGISEAQGLKSRDYQNHFNGTARNSTLRKSLGSLFGWRSDRIYDNSGRYRFNSTREQELTRWMRDNLVMLYWFNLNIDIGDLETKLINELDPPLNISKNKSPINEAFRKELKKLRS
jgi:hypothetical protein